MTGLIPEIDSGSRPCFHHIGGGYLREWGEITNPAVVSTILEVRQEDRFFHVHQGTVVDKPRVRLGLGNFGLNPEDSQGKLGEIVVLAKSK